MKFISRASSKALLQLDLLKSIDIKIIKQTFIDKIVYFEIGNEHDVSLDFELVEKLFQSVSLPFIVKNRDGLTFGNRERHFFPFAIKKQDFSKSLPNGYAIRDYLDGAISGSIIEEQLMKAVACAPEELETLVCRMALIRKSKRNQEWLNKDGLLTPIMADIINHVTKLPIKDVSAWYKREMGNVDTSLDEMIHCNTVSQKLKTRHMLTNQLLKLAECLSYQEQELLHPIFKTHIHHHKVELNELEIDEIKYFGFIKTIIEAYESTEQPEIASIIYHKAVVWATVQKVPKSILEQLLTLIDKSRQLEPELVLQLTNRLSSLMCVAAVQAKHA